MTDRPSRRALTRVSETSAGGFVLASDGSNRVALIGRTNRAGALDWSLPKGHPEGAEDLQQAAVREIAEETGLEAKVLHSIGNISYEFVAGGKLISKTVHHFVLRQTGGYLTVENDPQREAADVQWFELSELTHTLSHENERRLVSAVIQWVEQN